jgi:hypothetical protein
VARCGDPLQIGWQRKRRQRPKPSR